MYQAILWSGSNIPNDFVFRPKIASDVKKDALRKEISGVQVEIVFGSEFVQT